MHHADKTSSEATSAFGIPDSRGCAYRARFRFSLSRLEQRKGHKKGLPATKEGQIKKVNRVDELGIEPKTLSSRLIDNANDTLYQLSYTPYDDH